MDMSIATSKKFRVLFNEFTKLPLKEQQAFFQNFSKNAEPYIGSNKKILKSYVIPENLDIARKGSKILNTLAMNVMSHMIFLQKRSFNKADIILLVELMKTEKEQAAKYQRNLKRVHNLILKHLLQSGVPLTDKKKSKNKKNP